MQSFNILARPCSRADWFESYLTTKTGFLVSRSIIEFHNRTLQASERRKGFFCLLTNLIGILVLLKYRSNLNMALNQKILKKLYLEI